MLPPAITEPAAAVVARLRERGETVAVAESAAGGLIAAALVAVPGVSRAFRGGMVVYQLDAARIQLAGDVAWPEGQRSATEPFTAWLAAAVAARLGADWGVGETGASGPAGNPYGDPAGHAWTAVHGPAGADRSRHVLTGDDDRAANMVAFAGAALDLLLEALDAPA